MASVLYRLPDDADLETVIRQVMVRIVELEPRFVKSQVEPEARRKVAEFQAADPDISMSSLWTAAERYLADWHRGIAHPPEKSQEPAPGSVADLADANRALSIPRNPPVPQWW